MSQQFAPDWFSPPGSTVAMLMARQNVNSSELARRMKADTAFVLRIISGTEPIEETVARRLAAALGGTPSFWTARQSKFEAALDRTAGKLAPEAAKTWLRTLPLKDMSDAGWIACRSKSNLLQAALAYFSVTTPDEWRDRYAAHATTFSYRTSEAFESKLGALAAWLRQGELQASGFTCATWNPVKFKEALAAIRGLTRLKEPASFIGRLRSLCAAAGVAVVFIKAPTGCRASGATRFITPSKAMIILSFRHLSDDHFWFSFFHEAGHLLLHSPGATFVDGEAAEFTEKEREANAFAANSLVPIREHERMLSLRGNVNAVVRFAVSLGIAPGIVVGQLQHHEVISPSQLNGLKRRYTWDQVQAAISDLNP
jgi:Zn-dependent peptidase ImmA (M78 family)/plasmid maintenance system antidote protein VapI